MKRSEMIVKVKELMKHQISLEEADEFLAGLEFAGMKPPAIGLIKLGYDCNAEIYEWEQE